MGCIAAPEKKSAVKASVVAARRMRGLGFGVTVSASGGAPPNSQLSLCEFRCGIAWLLLRSSAVAATPARIVVITSIRSRLRCMGYRAPGAAAVSLGRGNGATNHQSEGSASPSIGSMIAAEIDQSGVAARLEERNYQRAALRRPY